MRAIIDTNVFIAGLLWRGSPHVLLEHARAGTLAVISSSTPSYRLDQDFQGRPVTRVASGFLRNPLSDEIWARDAASRSLTMAGGLAVEYSWGVMATLPSPSASPDAAEDLLFREQCRRQLRRPVEARMKYGFCRVSRPGLDVPAARVFASTREYREWCAANLPAYLGYQPAPPE